MSARHEQIGTLFKAAAAEARRKNPQLDRAGTYEVLEAARALSEAEALADVQRLFGEETARQFETCRATLPVRQVVKQLAGALTGADVPLSDAQANGLIEIMARHSVGALGKIDLMNLNVERVVSEAQAMLSEAQTAELRRRATAVRDAARAEYLTNTASEATLRAMFQNE